MVLRISSFKLCTLCINGLDYNCRPQHVQSVCIESVGGKRRQIERLRTTYIFTAFFILDLQTSPDESVEGLAALRLLDPPIF